MFPARLLVKVCNYHTAENQPHGNNFFRLLLRCFRNPKITSLKLLMTALELFGVQNMNKNMDSY